MPRENAADAIAGLLATIARSGEGSVLAVLKTFGERWPPGLLSFARPGVTLALDFHNRARIEALFERLDASSSRRAAGSTRRRTPACRARVFEAGYPRLARIRGASAIPASARRCRAG